MKNCFEFKWFGGSVGCVAPPGEHLRHRLIHRQIGGVQHMGVGFCLQRGHRAGGIARVPFLNVLLNLKDVSSFPLVDQLLMAAARAFMSAAWDFSYRPIRVALMPIAVPSRKTVPSPSGALPCGAVPPASP